MAADENSISALKGKLVKAVIDNGVLAIISVGLVIFLAVLLTREVSAMRADIRAHAEVTKDLSNKMSSQELLAEVAARRQKFTCINTAVLARKSLQQALTECE